VTLVWANKNVPPKRAVRKNIFLSEYNFLFIFTILKSSKFIDFIEYKTSRF